MLLWRNTITKSNLVRKGQVIGHRWRKSETQIVQEPGSRSHGVLLAGWLGLLSYSTQSQAAPQWAGPSLALWENALPAGHSQAFQTVSHLRRSPFRWLPLVSRWHESSPHGRQYSCWGCSPAEGLWGFLFGFCFLIWPISCIGWRYSFTPPKIAFYIRGFFPHWNFLSAYFLQYC